MLEELKQAVCAANRDLQRFNLVVLSFGNVSGISREQGLVVIKPSGVAYEDLTPERMVVTDLAGKVVEGRSRPSSDTPTHLQLYRAWPEIGGVTHTHSPCAAMFAQAGRPIPCLGTTHADVFRGEVPVTRAMTPEEVKAEYEVNIGKVLLEEFSARDPHEMPAVLVLNHGSFVWGRDPREAVENAVSLEESARLALGALQLNPGLGPIPDYLRDKHFFRKHGPGAYYGQKKN